MKPYHRLLLAAAAGALLTNCSTSSPVPNPDATDSGPNCDHPGYPEEAIWCRALPPDSTHELPAILLALDRMGSLGGICESLAVTLSGILERGNLHLFDRWELPVAAAAAPLGRGVRSYLLLSREMVGTYSDAAHASANIDSRGSPEPQTLQQVLAHEADHVRGLDHTDPDGYLTPNTRRCSDLR